MSGYRSGGQPAPASAKAAALAEMLLGLGFRAMAAQAAEELDEERLGLYAQIVAKNARAPRRAETLRRLEALGLL